MTDEKLSLTRRIQLKELEILKVFQDICRKHGLRYFAIGGTCLGAVRHKGFIPWDDDVDVAMPYEDYVKFRALSKTELPQGFSVIDMNAIKHRGMAYFLKMRDDSATFLERGTIYYPQRYGGVFIDIFPVHGLPSGKRSSTIVYKTSQILLHISNIFRMPLASMNKMSSHIAWLMLSPLRLILPYSYSKHIKIYLLQVLQVRNRWRTTHLYQVRNCLHS